jgi:hypothetical protein
MTTKNQAYLKRKLRDISFKRDAYSNAKKRYKVDSATFECPQCGVYCYEGKSEKNLTKLKEKYKLKTIIWEKIDMDHIEPVDIPELDEYDPYLWNFFKRLMCPEDGYQALCKTCHKKKSKKETDIRSERKRNSRGTARTTPKSKGRKKDS